MRKLIIILIAIMGFMFTARGESAPMIQQDSIEALSVTIFGDAEMSVDMIYHFVKSKNKNFPREVAQTFCDVAGRYGIRGDIAVCQAILETGWFRHVNLSGEGDFQYNFGGIGCTGPGVVGNSFASLEEGITASIQHLYAYACTDLLPEGEMLVDPRFNLVNRGCATNWGDLSNRWAMNPYYGQRIITLYKQMKRFKKHNSASK